MSARCSILRLFVQWALVRNDDLASALGVESLLLVPFEPLEGTYLLVSTQTRPLLQNERRQTPAQHPRGMEGLRRKRCRHIHPIAPGKGNKRKGKHVRLASTSPCPKSNITHPTEHICRARYIPRRIHPRQPPRTASLFLY